MKTISEWLVMFFVLTIPTLDCIRFPDEEEVVSMNKNQSSSNDERRNQLIFKENNRVRFPPDAAATDFFDLHSTNQR